VESSGPVKIAIDAMGGDFAPASIVEGAVQAAREMGLSPILVGREGDLERELRRVGSSRNEIEVVHASETIDMSEPPSLALRKKKDCSIRVACRLVKEGKASGIVSAGSTGAVMVASKIVIGTIEGVDRPAIAAVLPTQRGRMVLLDAGANVDCKPHHFRQFAVMGELYARFVLGVERPRIGLLSIGEEDTKGTEVTKEVFRFLSATHLNFIGNVEGNHVYSGDVDVIITDGFSGNISLKVTESIVSSLDIMVRREVAKSLRAKLGAWLLMPALRAIKKKTDYEEYGGAPLLGARECVIICHGRSSPKAIKNAVRVAKEFVVNRVAERIHEGIQTLSEAESRLSESMGAGIGQTAGGSA
jgi:glycerol-3-phosphate acyltransferase PlsX